MHTLCTGASAAREMLMPTTWGIWVWVMQGCSVGSASRCARVIIFQSRNVSQWIELVTEYHMLFHPHVFAGSLRMLSAALLLLEGSSTLPVGLWCPSGSSYVAFIASYRDDVLTITLVFFFMSSGSRYFVVRYGPTTFVLSTHM